MILYINVMEAHREADKVRHKKSWPVMPQEMNIALYTWSAKHIWHICDVMLEL